MASNVVTKSTIDKNLKRIKSLYDRNSDPANSFFYSKLAILELCGWIEESMDTMTLRCAKRKLKDSRNLEFVTNNIIKKQSSFHYDNNFRNMLMSVIGIINLEKIEKKLDLVRLQTLKSEINNLKPTRDKIAHTHVKGTQLIIDAPSVTIQKFKEIYDGFKLLEQELKKRI